jgi:hypothetical protein
MSLGSKAIMLMIITFAILTLLSIIGMGIITTAIFEVENNTFIISDSKLTMGKIALGFYWGLCLIATILLIINYLLKY